MQERYIVSRVHGESGTVFYVVDTFQPEDEQPVVIHSWNTSREPNAEFLATDFCRRHNRDSFDVDAENIRCNFLD